MQRLAILSGFGARAEEALILSFSALSPEQVFQFSSTVLQKPSQMRDSLDEKFLMKVFSSMPFYQKVVEEHGIETMKICCKHFGYEKHSPDSQLFRDSRSPKFYVLIKGGVSLTLNDKKSHSHGSPEVHDLGRGMCFGELPLISEINRFDSAYCKEECHFAVLARDSYEKIMADLTRRKLEAKAEELTIFSIFKGIAKKSLFSLVFHFNLEETPLNKVLFKEGDAVNNVYFVMSGKYKTLTSMDIPLIDEFESNLTLSPRFTKKATTRSRISEIGISGQGEIIGLEDLMMDRPRKTTVICVKPGVVYRVSAQDFRKRVLGSLNEFLSKDIQDYVKNRETWFDLKVKRVKEQIVKHKEFLVTIPTQGKEEVKKRVNSVETEKDLTPEIKVPASRARTKSAYHSQTIESPVTEAHSRGIYLTSLVESDIKTFNIPHSPITRKGRGSDAFDHIPSEFETPDKNTLKPDSPKRGEYLLDRLETNISERPKDAANRIPTSENKGGPRRLTPKRYMTKDRDEEYQEEKKQLFQTGIFEKNQDLNAIERFIPKSKKPISCFPNIKLVKDKIRNIPDAKSYFAEKDKLLSKLKKTSTQTWDLQSHLVKFMQENHDLSRRVQVMKQADVNMKKMKTPTFMSSDNSARRKLNQSMDVPGSVPESQVESPCVAFHLPKRFSSIGESSGMKVVSRSFVHSPGLTVFEVKNETPANLKESVAKFQKKVKGWKGPFAILSRRLKKKFVKSQLENLNVSLEYS